MPCPLSNEGPVKYYVAQKGRRSRFFLKFFWFDLCNRFWNFWGSRAPSAGLWIPSSVLPQIWLYVSHVYFVSAMPSHKISCTSYVFRLGRLSSLQCFWGVLGSVWCAKMRTKQELKTWSECFIGDHEMRTTSEALLVTCTPLQHTVLARQREPTPKIF